jgi:dTDP-4-dehydrorhamnose reductase
VLDRPGWWRRESRFYRPVKSSCDLRTVGAPRSLLVTGATGTLGRAFSRLCGVRGLDHCLSSRREVDIADAGSVERALRRIRPWAVINTAGFVRVAEAELEQDQCFRENSTGAAVLAEACARHGIPLVTFSSDLVFDGRLGRSYLESDPTGAGCTYGSSKAEAERAVLAAHPDALIARASAFFGPWDRHNFVWWVLDRLASGQTVEAGPDIVSPTYVPDLVHVVLDLLIDGERGIWHLANPGSVSWFDLARRVAERAGFPREAVRLAADRPALDTTLATERGALLPPLDSGLDRFFADCETDWAAASRRRMAAE